MDVDSFKTMPPLSSLVLNRSSKLPHGKAVTVNGKKIALFCINDRFYAIDEKCPHLGKCVVSLRVNTQLWPRTGKRQITLRIASEFS